MKTENSFSELTLTSMPCFIFVYHLFVLLFSFVFHIFTSARDIFVYLCRRYLFVFFFFFVVDRMRKKGQHEIKKNTNCLTLDVDKIYRIVE